MHYRSSNSVKTALFLAFIFLTSSTLANGEAVEELMDNINDPSHPDSKLGLTEEQILEIEREAGEPINIKNLEKEMESMEARWEAVKDSADLTDEEKKVLEDHLNSLKKLSDTHETVHERLNSLVGDIAEVDNLIKQAEANKNTDL